ncbi:type II toxin-antitoxin system PemK/MazF family toxin [Aetokthonos hydrillicola Thurmond2011]|jgi:mRNA interferase MazF|uniref:mRNA interferase n=1 Tax=Aetokthonos hydrillicola Thurmond2011 TaxID=2712845 RepID=A0AAP5ICK6_9CYAN|nr:type II toxin-antitoxin system PemK/MazF family toxin [Aetokthonos hydrillicola]MBO3460225.1 type II toxin-antitoxin system PemK/MazF family toxin [Aetokthonos hydrillicola CCALA 1050]MBW4586958.1 type II toxin-antitoxin system PemK/MazF family toxin [Aetokthonos hydrillicola CCALA 1050]MDR9897567.1 type II toxin-antitoxin system PemK/MazF family toxin [Aetokthonos hydrillicola Thurmond2011]
MKRGDIFYADLSPTVGSEIDKRRPVLIISNDANNRAATTVTVLPLTSNVNRVYPFEVLLSPEDSGLPKPSKVQAQQIRTISKERIASEVIGSLNKELMVLVDAAVKLHLGLL